MARRYRYAFAKKREAKDGKVSVGISAASLILFAAAVLISFWGGDSMAAVTGGVSLFAALISVYGFIIGLKSFSEADRTHRTSMIGSIANGIIMVCWLGLFLMGM